jgi:predicted small secreted protein
MKKSLTFIIVLFVVFMASGCGDTWEGAKKDTSENAEKSKDKVNEGAKYIEKKTD